MLTNFIVPNHTNKTMKTILLLCFLSFSIIISANSDRHIIKEIDEINSTALKHYDNHRILESFKGFLKAKKLSDSIRDFYGSATSNYNLGKIHFLMDNHDTAKIYYHYALDAAEKIHNDLLIANTYLSLAEIFNSNLNYSKGQQFLLKAIKHSNEKNYHTKSDIEALNDVALCARINLCKLNLDKGNLENTFLNLLRTEQYIENTKNNSSKGLFYYIYGLYYAKKQLYNNASSKYNKAIELLKGKEKDNYKLLSKVYEDLSISLAKSESEANEAYEALLQANKFTNKFLNEEKLKQEIIAKSKYLLEDFKNDIKEANQAKLEQIAIANRLKKVTFGILIMLLLLVASLAFIGYGYIAKRKLSKVLEVKNFELESARNDALKTSELKSKFISNVTHELRTPLYGVVGITSMLLENSNLDKDDRKNLKSLKYSGDYLLNLINDILQVGKIEAKEIKLKDSSVNLKSLFENIVNSFQSRLVETNNNINIIIDEEVPKYVRTDKVRLSQIIFNLLGNSIKFTSNGEINLRIRYLNENNEQVRLGFEVEDNGMGISKDKFKTIFDVFSQLDESNFDYKGTGLGLAITKNLIELFNSKIEVESEEGKGSIFRFAIDFAVEKEKENGNVRKALKRSLINQNNYHILVAEDNKINQIVTKNLLEKQNYSCTIVSNGKQAVEEFYNNKDKYDLILMDINMPVMNGNEATELIYKIDNNIPIIALTAADIEEVKSNYEEIGYKDIIIKPFDNYEFFQIINTQIHKSNMRKNGTDTFYNAC